MSKQSNREWDEWFAGLVDNITKSKQGTTELAAQRKKRQKQKKRQFRRLREIRGEK